MGRRALIIAGLIFSGSIQVVVSAPYSWVWLIPLYLMPGLWAIAQLRGCRAFLGGWLLGIAANMTIFYWLVHTVQVFSNLGTPVAIGVLALFGLAFGAYAGFFGWGFATMRRAGGGYWPVLAAAWWVTCEFLNPQLFPYFQGVALYQLPSVFLITTITGVPGVSFMILVWNCLVLWAVERWRRGESLRDPALIRATGVGVGLLVFSLVVSAGRLIQINAAEERAETLRVALVQTNLDVDSRARINRLGPSAVVDVFLDSCERALAADPTIDVFIWPEGAMRGDPMTQRNLRARNLVAEHGVEIWTGGEADERTGRVRKRFNSAYRIFGAGRIDERYDKIILVPFGEFMPLKETLPVLQKIRVGGRFSHGSGLQIYDSPKARFCFLICYEAIHHGLVSANVAEEVTLLVNITYDAWFGDTACAAQHLMLSAIESAQFGVPLVRAATTGISAIVDTRGMITHQTDVFVPATLVADVMPMRLPTLYGWLGNWFAWGCVLLTVGVLLCGKWQARRERRLAAAEREAAARAEAAAQVVLV